MGHGAKTEWMHFLRILNVPSHLIHLSSHQSPSTTSPTLNLLIPLESSSQKTATSTHAHTHSQQTIPHDRTPFNVVKKKKKAKDLSGIINGR